MEKKNKVNKALIVIIILLIIILCVLVGYVMVNDVMKINNKDSKDKNDINNSKYNIVYKNDDVISIEDKLELDKIIGTQGLDGLLILLDKDNLNELSNREIISYVYWEYIFDAKNIKDEISQEEVKNAFDKSALSDLSYEDGDMYYLTSYKDDVIMKYDADSKKYITPDIYASLSNETAGETMIAYTYNIDSYVKDNKYVIKNKYLFVNLFNLGGGTKTSTYVYGNYKNAKNDIENGEVNATNYVHKFDVNFIDFKEMEPYALKNYDSIKDKLDTYTYTFEKKDGHFVLTDFNVDHSK